MAMNADYSNEFAQVSVADGIATITIDREQRLNALHPAAHHALAHVFDTLEHAAEVRAIVLTGAGRKAFCAGYDLKDHLETGIMEIAPTGFAGLTNRFDYTLPIIAAVNGVALGGGFELALACDIIIAAKSASFALPEPKLGWAALSGGAQRLPHAIGIKRALDIILTGRRVSAEEGLALNLVSEIAEDDDLPAVSRRWAEQIVANAPLSIQCSRQAAYASIDTLGLRASMDMNNFPLVATMMDSADAAEGKQAFVERRPPVWSGR
jgi:enoyl-CoA hydratase/carnithine racemase